MAGSGGIWEVAIILCQGAKPKRAGDRSSIQKKVMQSFFYYIDRVHRTYRYLIALIVGVIIFVFAWPYYTAAFTCMISWIGFAVCVLFFAWTAILVKHPKEISTVASEQDASYLVIFTVVVAAAFTSLFAIILLLHGMPAGSRRSLNIHIILAVVAVGLSWLLIHTLFTIRYAHLYYTLPSNAVEDSHRYAGGLLFPGEGLPDFLDFAYFSFVVGMTFQTADVSISGRTIRRLSLLHGMLSFVYNTSIIALSINIISGLVEQ